MKINFGKIANAVIKIGTPIVITAVLHQQVTGKLDLKGAALDALASALDKRKA